MTFRNVFASLSLVAALAACSTPEPTPPRVAVWQGETSGVLFMRVLSEQPLRDARLVTPDGKQVLTQRLTQPESMQPNAPEPWNRPTFGIGGAAGSNGGFGTGLGVSFPMGGGGGGSRPGALATQAEFALTTQQIAQYRAKPQDWLLELRFDTRIASMPAPALVP